MRNTAKMALGLLVAGGLTWTALGAPHGTPNPSPAGDAGGARPATQPAVRPEVPGPPTTQPGRIGPGDLLVVDFADLAPGAGLPKPVRVEADGSVPLYIVPAMRVAGMTTAEAEEALAKAYRRHNVAQSPVVAVRRIQVAGAAGADAAGPFRPFDLVRVAVADLGGGETVRVTRVGPDGAVGLPYLGKQAIADLTPAAAEQAIVKAYHDHNLIQDALVSVVRLEPAPPGAERIALPDVPVFPVPDAIRPLLQTAEHMPQPERHR